jgi:hypothetical protein
MKCLTEIAGVTVTHYDDKFIGKFSPLNLALASVYICRDEGFRKFYMVWGGGATMECC